MCNTCIIMGFRIKINLFKYKLRDSKMEGVPSYKNTRSSHLKLINPLCVQPRCPLNGGRTWVPLPRKKSPFPLNRGVPSIEVTDIQIT